MMAGELEDMEKIPKVPESEKPVPDLVLHPLFGSWFAILIIYE